MNRMPQRGFTLVEILIVVVILGILAAVVVPQFSSATQDSKLRATLSQLHHLRNAMSVYSVQHSGRYPTVREGPGTWGELITLGYLKRRPTNNWVGGANATVITLADSPDAAYHQSYGWVFAVDGAPSGTPEVWAAGFTGDDQPLFPD